MKRFSYLFAGFMISLFFIIFIDFELLKSLDNFNFKPLIKYIGPAIFGSFIIHILCIFGERLDRIEKYISKLKENEKTS